MVIQRLLVITGRDLELWPVPDFRALGLKRLSHRHSNRPPTKFLHSTQKDFIQNLTGETQMSSIQKIVVNVCCILDIVRIGKK